MKKQIFLLSFLIFGFCFLKAQKENCNIWLENMAAEVEKGNTAEAIKMMKWFVNCKGNELGNEHPIIKNLNQMSLLTPFENGVATARLKTDEWVIINQDFEVVKKTDYDRVRAFSDGLALVGIKSGSLYDFKYGYIDTHGNEIITPQYEKAEDFSEGLAAVIQKNEYGINNWGFINKKNEIVIPHQYTLALDFRNGVAAVGKIHYLYGTIDKSNREVIPIKYHNIVLLDKIILAKLDEKWGVFDYKGKPLTDFNYDYLNSSNKGKKLVVFKKNNKFGFMDQDLNVVINPKYDHAEVFNNGKAIVSVNNKWGMINEENQLILPLEYSHIEKFHSAYFSEISPKVALAAKNNKFGFINEKGEAIVPFIYDEINVRYQIDKQTVIFAKKNGKWGILDDNNASVKIPFRYDYFSAITGDSTISVKIGERKFFEINTNGVCVKDCQNAPAGHP